MNKIFTFCFIVLVAFTFSNNLLAAEICSPTSKKIEFISSSDYAGVKLVYFKLEGESDYVGFTSVTSPDNWKNWLAMLLLAKNNDSNIQVCYNNTSIIPQSLSAATIRPIYAIISQ